LGGLAGGSEKRSCKWGGAKKNVSSGVQFKGLGKKKTEKKGLFDTPRKESFFLRMAKQIDLICRRSGRCAPEIPVP